MHLKSRRNFIKTVSYAAFTCLTTLFGTSSFVCKERKDQDFEPGYLKLHKSGELKKRGEKLWELLESCELCPRMCGVNKLKGKKGFCQANSQLEISSYHPHFGEEKPLVGKGGSGTIFLTNCGLRCVFCINWEVSQGGVGSERSIEEFAGQTTGRAGGCSGGEKRAGTGPSAEEKTPGPDSRRKKTPEQKNY